MNQTDSKEKTVLRMGVQAALWRRTASRLFANHFFVRRGRTKNGSFDTYVSAGAQLSVLSPRLPIDPSHERFIETWVKKDSVVWDIGGNMGLFAFPAALKAREGQVYVFEPDVELAANLVRSTRRKHNAGLNITVVPCAAADTDGPCRFLISAYGRSMNKLAGVGAWHDGIFRSSEERMVTTMRIDTAIAVLKPPSVIKIDVEGAEMMVLEGGRKTIQQYRPVLTIEGPDELADAFKAYFDELRYVILDGASENPSPITHSVWNLVAVPNEVWKAHAATQSRRKA